MTEVPGGIETSLLKEGLGYGFLGILFVISLLVIRYLYRESKAEQKVMELERRAWAVKEEQFKGDLVKLNEQFKADLIKRDADVMKERETCRADKETLRAEYERRNRETLEGYTTALAAQHAAIVTRDDATRREFLANIEKLAVNASDRDEALLAMLKQFYDKIVK